MGVLELSDQKAESTNCKEFLCAYQIAGIVAPHQIESAVLGLEGTHRSVGTSAWDTMVQ